MINIKCNYPTAKGKNRCKSNSALEGLCVKHYWITTTGTDRSMPITPFLIRRVKEMRK